MLVLPDGAAPSPADREEIAKWIERGGVVVRFAGPHLADGGDDLLPTPLRRGGRTLGGALSWGQPTALAASHPTARSPASPIPKDVTHLAAGAGRADARPRRQDLGAADRRHAAGHRREARPGLARAGPHHGQHRMVQPRALGPVREHAAAARHAVARRRRRRRNKALPPVETLDGFGRLGAPPAGAQMLPADADRPSSPRRPPARLLWRRERAGRSTSAPVGEPKPLVLPSGVSTDRLSEGGEIDLARRPAGRRTAAACSICSSRCALRGLLPRAVRLGRAAPAALLLAAAPSPSARAARRQHESPAADAQRGAGTTSGSHGSPISAPASPMSTTSRAGLAGLSDVLQPHRGRDRRADGGRYRDMTSSCSFRCSTGRWPPTQPPLRPRRSSAQPLPRDRRHDPLRHARPAAAVRSSGDGNPDLERLQRHRDAAAGAGAARPRADQVVLPDARIPRPLERRQALGRAGDGRVNDGVATVIVGGND